VENLCANKTAFFIREKKRTHHHHQEGTKNNNGWEEEDIVWRAEKEEEEGERKSFSGAYCGYGAFKARAEQVVDGIGDAS
jgi:hypothetical protein